MAKLRTWRVIEKINKAQLDDLSPIDRHWILAAGKPHSTALPRFSSSLPEMDEGDGNSLHRIARLEMGIADDHAVKEFIRAIGTSETVARVAIALADDITSLLLQAIRLGEAAELSKTLDRTYWALPSISEHDQNESAPDWTLLVLLCRQTFEVAAQKG